MKLRVLVDNNTYIDHYYYGEPALCFYIEDEETKILFDTGYSQAFMENARKMGIDLDQIDKIVFSHGHNDHTGGLAWFLKEGRKCEIIAHPDTFNYREDETGVISSPLSLKQIREKTDVTLSKEPLRISRHLLYLGEIRNQSREKRIPIGNVMTEKGMISDYIYDDSALVYEGEQGIFVITGCSHSGICNIIEYARAITSQEKVRGVIGGFHLPEADQRLYDTIRYFRENDIEELYPCHCVSLACKCAMAAELKIHEVGVGMELEIN